jgi:hypothetical protein
MKIKSKSLSHFSAPKNVRQFTTFATQLTTLSPQKTQCQPPNFSKIPAKTALSSPPPHPKKPRKKYAANRRTT